MASPHPPLLQNTTSDDPQLDQSLTDLETFLSLLGFYFSLPRAIISWIAFFSLAVILPLVSIEFSRCVADCENLEIERFEIEAIVMRAMVAAVSLLCVSRNLRKYGIRKALFVDRCNGNTASFRDQYIQKIRKFYRFLAMWFGVCLLLKIAREVTRIVYLNRDPWWWSIILFAACILSWSYTTLVFLAGCGLFNVVGNLQVIHFENYGKVLERDLDVSLYIEEHMHLSHDLSKISHRFRIFLLLQFLIVSGSQFMTLLHATENQGVINLINGGDFLVLAILELVGLVICLSTATKISHRAQSLGSVAARWHALVTCNSNEALRPENNGSNSEASYHLGSLPVSYSESDLESSDYTPLPVNLKLTSSTSSYDRRQAFVTYVQSNTGGFTIFGWIIDRMLMNTIFFMELSLVFFVLGKTIIITVR